MENFSTLIENSKRAVRYWWLLLIIGIALFVVGILVFVYPTQSYLGMSLLFGWLMLISGILEVVLSSVNKHFITGRGWMLAGGIIEIAAALFALDSFPAARIRHHGRHRMGRHLAALRRGRRLFALAPAPPGAPLPRRPLKRPRHITQKPLPRQGLFRTRPCKILKHQGEQGSRSPPENTPPRPPR